MTYLRRFWPVLVVLLGIGLAIWEVANDRHQIPLLMLGAVLIAVGGIKYLLGRHTNHDA